MRVDHYGRTPISDGMKAKIDAAFQAVPQGKRGALLIIADERGARAHVAAQFADGWKVAGGLGRRWTGEMHAEVMVMGVW